MRHAHIFVLAMAPGRKEGTGKKTNKTSPHVPHRPSRTDPDTPCTQQVLPLFCGLYHCC